MNASGKHIRVRIPYKELIFSAKPVFVISVRAQITINADSNPIGSPLIKAFFKISILYHPFIYGETFVFFLHKKFYPIILFRKLSDFTVPSQLLEARWQISGQLAVPVRKESDSGAEGS